MVESLSRRKHYFICSFSEYMAVVELRGSSNVKSLTCSLSSFSLSPSLKLTKNRFNPSSPSSNYPTKYLPLATHSTWVWRKSVTSAKSLSKFRRRNNQSYIIDGIPISHLPDPSRMGKLLRLNAWVLHLCQYHLALLRSSRLTGLVGKLVSPVLYYICRVDDWFTDDDG